MAFKLGKRSKQKLEGVHPDMVKVVETAIGLTKVDFGVTYGVRTVEAQEKLVASLADRFVVVVDSTKMVRKLNLGFKLPVEVLPSAWKLVQERLSMLSGFSELRMAEKKAGPIVTDQGNLVLDVTFLRIFSIEIFKFFSFA